MHIGGRLFREVWVADFEFSAPPGERPAPICMVAREVFSDRTIRIWGEELLTSDGPPFEAEDDVLFVAYYAPAEIGCYLALGWPIPWNILDLYVEFRNDTNGLQLPSGRGLLGACVYYGLRGIGMAEKEEMRELAIRGGPWTEVERVALLDYCGSDVETATALLRAMAPRIDIERALLRGRYMSVVARIEAQGIPIDVPSLSLLRTHWLEIQEDLIEEIDRDFGIYDGRKFSIDRFASWLSARGIAWPRTETGRLSLSDDTFKNMVKSVPELAPVRELRSSLGRLRLMDLAVGSDGRNRCMLSPFASKTGRNQPSNAKYIFGPSVWLRGLIRPGPGMAIAYVDYSQQEFGIAAALSGDSAMIAAYLSADPYMAFAIQAGAAPAGATKATHAAIRERFKACALAVLYGMGAKSLASRARISVAEAKELLRLHRRTYPLFWAWSERVGMHAFLHGKIRTAFGWTLYTARDANPRSVANFPMQANGAEILRLACILTAEAGIMVGGPVHDALLIVSTRHNIKRDAAMTSHLMVLAGKEVLRGFELRTDTSIVQHPDRYMDPRGEAMWNKVWELIIKREEA